ncbi:CfaE/CblD family pilus tip adhesin [Stenotrophomonas sepilia]|uniref:CfaE/CblD family pilus tip adhesin n=2 Tax=Stenotrophomonas sepilia TaxID=2860290 RepID=UPI002E7A835C|nr:CfaE/CblD family pilus tip adhesin [Stenotrophomonas sepilia]
MSRRVLFVLMLVCALAVLMPRAWAQKFPEIHPTDETRRVTESWDRSAVPAEVVLWSPMTLLAFQEGPDSPYEVSHLVCLSDTDASRGRCPVIGNPEARGNALPVWFYMTDQRTGLRTEIHALGYIKRPLNGPNCSSDHWGSLIYPIWSSVPDVCRPLISGGIGVSLAIRSSELKRLVAGAWAGRIELQLRQTRGGPLLATYAFDLAFTVTDYDAISIYFPAFDTIAPLVNMDLRYDPIKQMVGGRKQLEMCLYDGLGSQSEFLGVTVRDSGPRPPPGSDFAVWHRDGGSDDRQRLDYHVSLNYGGRDIRMRHGVEELLHGIESAELRLVMLPGISQPVYCVPTPLTLLTPPTPIASKRPGLYEGELTVELRVPTAKP